MAPMSGILSAQKRWEKLIRVCHVILLEILDNLVVVLIYLLVAEVGASVRNSSVRR
jgi:hypothetical protein